MSRYLMMILVDVPDSVTLEEMEKHADDLTSAYYLVPGIDNVNGVFQVDKIETPKLGESFYKTRTVVADSLMSSLAALKAALEVKI